MLDYCFPPYWSFAYVVILFRNYLSFFRSIRLDNWASTGEFWTDIWIRRADTILVVMLCQVKLPKLLFLLSYSSSFASFFTISFFPFLSFFLSLSLALHLWCSMWGGVEYEIIFCTGATIIHGVQGNWKKKSTRKRWKWWEQGLFLTRMEQRAERDVVARVTKVWARRFVTE